MPFQPPIECPLCRKTLEPDRTLEDHLVGCHTQLEVARRFAALQEETGMQPASD